MTIFDILNDLTRLELDTLRRIRERRTGYTSQTQRYRMEWRRKIRAELSVRGLVQGEYPRLSLTEAGDKILTIALQPVIF